MAGVYQALLPRVHADLRHGAWVRMLEFSSVAEDPRQRFALVAERAYPAGVLVLDDLAVYALREPVRRHLERLLRYRAGKDLPTFFIAESLERVGERAGAAIAAFRHGAVHGGGHVRAKSPPVDRRTEFSRAGRKVPRLV